MKNIIKKAYILIGLLSVLTTHSQVVLTGRVTDQKSKEPLFGVNIFIPDLLTGATTDTLGSYKIVNLPKRKVLVRISYIGYKTIIQPVDLTTSQNKDFTMEESPEEMNEVVVTGTSKATDIRRSPIPIVVMEIKESI